MQSKDLLFNMNKLVEEEIGNCITCQSLTPPKPPQHFVSTKMPEKVWKTINMDYLRPLPNGKYCLVLIDQRSRYPVVAFTTTTNTISLIKVFGNVFAQYGLPDRVLTDKGPSFTSTNVKNYFKSKRVYCQKITSRCPKANGEVEGFMQLLSKIIEVAYIEHIDWENSVHQCLYSYRKTPYSQDAQKIKGKSKCYQDQTQRMQTRKTDISTRVIVKQQKQNKLITSFLQYPYAVTNVRGSMITAFSKDIGYTITRNISFFKVIPVTTKAQRARIEIQGENIAYHRCLNKQFNNQEKLNYLEKIDKQVHKKLIQNVYNAT